MSRCLDRHFQNNFNGARDLCKEATIVTLHINPNRLGKRFHPQIHQVYYTLKHGEDSANLSAEDSSFYPCQSNRPLFFLKLQNLFSRILEIQIIRINFAMKSAENSIPVYGRVKAFIRNIQYNFQSSSQYRSQKISKNHKNQ